MGPKMFLKESLRFKDGKEHHYWSVVENRRRANGRVTQRHVLYLGEINDSQMGSWRRTIELLQEGEARPKQVALYPADRQVAAQGNEVIQIRMADVQLHRPRQWGARAAAKSCKEKRGRGFEEIVDFFF